MGRVVKVLASVLLGYVCLALLLGGLIAYFQPQREGTLLLRTFDQTGTRHETVLRSIEDGHGGRWLWSAKWFRGWYVRALDNPAVEIVLGETVEKRIAVPIADAATVERIVNSQRDGVSTIQWWAGRATLLFAPIKIIRLDEP